MPAEIQAHQWVRTILYRTTNRDIDDGVVFLTDNTRISVGEPFCGGCGSAYPPASGACGDQPEPEVEPVVSLDEKRSTRKSRDARVTAASE